MRIMGGHSLLGAMAAACGLISVNKSPSCHPQDYWVKRLRPLGERPADTFNGDLVSVHGPKVGKGTRRQRKEATRKRCLTKPQ